VGEGRRGAHCAAAREEAAALLAHLGWEEGEGGGRTRPCELARPAWPLGARRPGGPAGQWAES
jgi:hypothetical protein